MKVRRCLSPQDKSSAIAIRRRVFIEEKKVPESVEIDGLDDQSVAFLIVNENDRPVGTARWRQVGSLLKFERIAVLREVRGWGFGKALLEYMQQLSDLVHPRHLKFLTAKRDSVSFYEKMGWTPIGKEFLEAGISHRAMVFVPRQPEEVAELLIWDDREAPSAVLEYLKELGKWLPK